MGTGYTRNDTVNNIADGNIINAADLDGEFDAIQDAFNETTGHTHDGTSAEGGPITVVGPAQEVSVSATAVVPATDNTIDLGSAANEFKDLYIDGTANIDSLVADTADINGGTLDNVTIGGATPAAATVTNLTVNGNTTLGDAATDTVTFNADVASNLIPSADNTHDLGASGSEWKDLYIDGTANIDSLVADTADINGGTIDNAIIGGGTAAAGTFTTLTGTTGNITTVNATTVDTTNIEVTNIKAKDGTASATIADSTGVMTVASAVLTTADVNGGTIDNAIIGGGTAAAGTFTTATATTGNITTVNATTVDTTNLEVTNIKAKDGTSAGSIADSTGVVTLASSVLTTTDINGGTIDNAPVGASTASTGAFTTLTASSTTTLNGTTIPASKTLVVTTDIGSTVQGYDAQLADVAGLTPANGAFIVGDGTNFITESDATARTSLGLGSIATQAANNVDIDGGAIDGITLGTNSAVTQAQIDNVNINGNTISSTDTDGDLNLTPNGTGDLVLDGLKWPQADGVADYVLKTDGVGQLSWTPVSTSSGTVTSVDVSGGTTGLTTSGGPVTSSGTITLAGTLGVANGGTGATTLTANNVVIGNGTSAVNFVAPGTSGNLLTSNGTTWTSAAPAPGGIEYEVKTANYTAADKEGILADTTGGAFTVTLPATPATGAQVIVADPAGTWGTNNLTIGRNGETIADVAEDLVCDISGVSVQLVYDGSTWAVYAQVGGNGGTVVTEDGTQTLTNKTLAATTLSGTLSVADNIVNRPILEDYAIQGSAIGATGATATIDMEVANFFSATIDEACTFTFSNPPASGDFGAFVLELTNGGDYAVTYPASVEFPGGVAPTLTATGVDQLVFTTRDGGTTYFAFVAGLDIKSP